MIWKMKLLDKAYEIVSNNPKIAEYGHIALFIVWFLLIIPTILFWNSSILWVAFMSVYAILAQHATGYSAARGARKAKESQDK